MQFPKELQPGGCGRAPRRLTGLNEVQFPKELQPDRPGGGVRDRKASMKCSSRRNCNATDAARWRPTLGLNEVQFPKELQLRLEIDDILTGGLNEVQFPKELQPQTGKDTTSVS